MELDLTIKDERIDMMHGFNSIAVKAVPDPPNELIEFRMKDKYERRKLAKDFNSQGFIQDSMEDKSKAEQHNYSTFKQLFDLYERCKKTDRYGDLKLIEEKLNQFEGHISSCKNQFRALMIDFTKYDYSRDNQVDWDE